MKDNIYYHFNTTSIVCFVSFYFSVQRQSLSDASKIVRNTHILFLSLIVLKNVSVSHDASSSNIVHLTLFRFSVGFYFFFLFIHLLISTIFVIIYCHSINSSRWRLSFFYAAEFSPSVEKVLLQNSVISFFRILILLLCITLLNYLNLKLTTQI